MQLYDAPPPDYSQVGGTQTLWRWGPGKSGPRLIQDLADHVLSSDILIRFPDSLTETSIETTKHSWIADLLHNEDFEDGTILRACCEHTRCHVELLIDYASDGGENLAQHCQARERLHHFQLLAEETVRQPGKYDGFTWSCSRCPTTLTARIRGPEISDELLQDLYKIRPQSSFSKPKTGVDETRPSRYSSLTGLEYLLRNTATFNLTHEPNLQPREIQFAPGTMFEKRVGHEREVIELMRHLMFTFCPADHEPGDYIDEEMAYDEMTTDGVEWVFRPADPTQPGVRGRFRRLRLEMQLLAMKAYEDLGDVHRNRPWLVKHIRAEPSMQKLLDATTGLFSSTTNSIHNDSRSAEEPCYHKLGITMEFTDSALIDFFNLQVKHDQPNTSYYMSALEAIAKRRDSIILLTEFQKQKSMGAYTRQDVRNAYATLLSGNSDATMSVDAEDSDEDDETLINIAASLMIDNASVKHKIRTALEIIGTERDSFEIRKYLNTPERDFPDIDAALYYLGAESSTEDDFLITLFDIKQEDNATLARSALETIADERKNVRLRRFLDTGERDALPSVEIKSDWDVEMLDPDLAYSRLGVDDRSTDDDMLIMLYEIRIADDPVDQQNLKRALELLGDTRRSQLIKTYLATGTKEPVMYVAPDASTERPVGLENIGNTCYLNSLLQYYFTIQPLRNAILQPAGIMENELNQDILLEKKVGGRSVSREEIERALRFAVELRKLFRTLISSATASIKPSRAVCFLALVSQREESEHRRSRLASSQLNKTVISDLETNPTNQLVLFNTSETSELDTTEQSDHRSTTADMSGRSPKRKASISWQDVDYAAPEKADHGDNASDHGPVASPTVSSHTALGSGSPEQIPVASPSLQVSGDLLDLNENTVKEEKAANVDQIFIDPSSRFSTPCMEEEKPTAPPVMMDLVDVPALPERPPFKRRQSSLLLTDNSDWGQQQDVAECIDNVLFQLEAAFRATGHDKDGEQIDLIKDLFYGITKQKLSIKDNLPKYERFSNTIVTLERDGQDLYQALDGVFDARLVDLDKQHVMLNLTIAQAPPILQIQIQRVGFDRERLCAVKSNVYLALDQSIYLDRYMETEDPTLIQKREDCWKWKKELKEAASRRLELENLNAIQEVTAPVRPSDHIWSATENEVSSEDEDLMQIEDARRGSVKLIQEIPTTAPVLAREELVAQLRSQEAQERDLSFKLTHVFDDHAQYEYRLHSVFIHRGEASHGHYWVYIYDFELDKWRKYNDEEVTDVAKSEVFKDRTGSNENPYMLSYVRADRLAYTHALEREMDKVWDEESLL